MTAAPARQPLVSLPDCIASRLGAWRVRLAKAELASRMGSPDADRRRRRIVDEVAAALCEFPSQQQSAVLPRLARELRLSPGALTAALAARPQQQADPPAAGVIPCRATPAAAAKPRPTNSDVAALFFALGQRRAKDVQRLLAELLDRVDPTWAKK